VNKTKLTTLGMHVFSASLHNLTFAGS